ncbi:hypothetical protein [Proteiniborus sp. MB09-C3]|uniref:hypothetical protein n=1 Tax=Proteiniborus sp. MB09-C3 TaxID=3050072 RepID=UPI002554A6F3|nr:hypothetical protein [Proteiniborus sp. MB09-C3]WIV12900.1 hypothetical protein QO263_04075 [Proteiniborus sp. MB09-C3]
MLEVQNSNTSSTKYINLELTKYETINNLEGVTMRIKTGTLSTEGVSIIFDNKSDNEFT